MKGRISETAAYRVAMVAFVLAAVVGVGLIAARGWPIAVLGVIGLAAGYFYTAPPFQYKFRALGVPLVFLLMGPLMTLGGYYAVSGTWSPIALVLSIPIGLLVAAILHGNEWRDISEDTRAGIATLSSEIGRSWAHYSYLGLILGAYITLGLAVAFGVLPPATLVAILSLPFLVIVLRSAELGASGQARAIAMIDLQTARLHADVRGAADRRAAPERSLPVRRSLCRAERRPKRRRPALARPWAGRRPGGLRPHLPRPAAAVLAADDGHRPDPRRPGARDEPGRARREDRCARDAPWGSPRRRRCTRTFQVGRSLRPALRSRRG